MLKKTFFICFTCFIFFLQMIIPPLHALEQDEDADGLVIKEIPLTLKSLSGENGEGAEKRSADDNLVWVKNPTLSMYRTENTDKIRYALIICPGGGYQFVVIKKEGHAIARRLVSEEMACFVLKYRHDNHDIALKDAVRAMEIVRKESAKWGKGIKVGFAGFSAGAHLSINIASNPKLQKEQKFNHMLWYPDFLMLAYPMALSHLPKGWSIDQHFPPSFIIGCISDKPAERIFPLAKELDKAGGRYALHLFSEGEHGFGLAESLKTSGQWPDLFMNWLKEAAFK